MPYRDTVRSRELYRRAQELIPGGTQLISRRPSRYAAGISPAYAARARGARFWDVDGNEYIDWASGIGAIILGYCDPVVDAAVLEQISNGIGYSISHPLEIELAEELIRTIPCAERVRYTRAGGEACAVAARIARGATGRDRILFCGYHGWHDWYLAANLADDGTLDSHLFPGIEPIGVPRALAGTSLPFRYGDIEHLSELLAAHEGTVAAVFMEPLRSSLPPVGYLEQVRELCSRHGVVLVFDEVSTGFRMAPGGVQEALGVTPDLAIFAKSISNGYAMGAVVGCKAVMDAADPMFISSTSWSEPIGLAAALTTLREIRARNAPAQLAAFGRELQTTITAAAASAGLPAVCAGLPTHPVLQYLEGALPHAAQLSTLYIQEMARRGCHGYAGFVLNTAQGAAELEQTVTAAREVFRVMTTALETGSLESAIECDLSRDAFRRLVS